MKKILRSMLAMMIAAFTLASCSDVPSPYGLFTSGDEELEGATGTGTLDDPFNVPGVLNYIKTLPAGTQSDVVYVKGFVSALVDGQNYDAGFGNGTFFISADGNAKNQFEVYRALYLENQSYVDGPIANLGDEVIICGKVTMHGSTPETVDKEAYLYSINGTTHYDARIFGTAEEPLSVADALTIINGLENGETIGKGYVKGIVCQAPSNISAGKLTYYISDDGKSSNSLQVYKGLGLNQAKFSAVSDLAVGDEVVIFGPMTRYSNGNPELNDGNYLISLKKGEGGGGEEETIGTKDSPKTVAEAITLINALGDKETSQQKAYVKGKVVKVTTNQTNFEKYGNLNYFISDDGQDANTIQVYGGDGLNGDKFQSITDIKQGDEVIVYGNLYKFVNNSGITPEITNSYLVALNDSEGGGEGESGGTNLLTNGDFETWSNNQPDNWTPASSAGGATMSQSNNAHGGSYSVSVGYTASSNKRMAHKEIELEAGTYTFTFYAKATSDGKCQTQAGWVKVVNNAVSGNYTYGGYVDLNNNSWTKVSVEFTLTEKTTICPLMMNPKGSNFHTSQNILVDDATLVKK